MDLFLQRRIDGIVTKDSTSYANAAWRELVAAYGLPYVSVEGYAEDDGISSILIDYANSVRRALDYVSVRTDRSPVYVELYTGPDYRPNGGDRQRRFGYEGWMNERGATPVIHSVPDEPWARAEAVWIGLMKGLAPGTPLLVNWSRGAVHVYRAAYRLGLRVGTDVPIIALDDTERVNRHLVPSLTAIEVPYEDMGAAAGRRLIAMLNGEAELTAPDKLWLSAQLSPRESL